METVASTLGRSTDAALRIRVKLRQIGDRQPGAAQSPGATPPSPRVRVREIAKRRESASTRTHATPARQEHPAIPRSLRPLLSLLGIVIAAAVVGAMSGCAVVADAAYSAAFRTTFVDATKLSAEELQQLSAIQFREARNELFYVSRGKVTGLACSGSVAPLVPVFVWTPPLSEVNGRTPREVAMTQLKIKALKLGANAVLSPSCVHHEIVDWGNNCFESWACKGEAVQTLEVIGDTLITVPTYSSRSDR